MRAIMVTALRSAAALLLMAGMAYAATPKEAEAQSLSDESVNKLMTYAWQQLPERFTKPNGDVVQINKTAAKTDQNELNKILVPVDVAREVIIAGRRSALAQLCGLENHQIANYRSLMIREANTKKWNEQQLVYMNVLHLTVVQIFAGEITIKQTGEDGKTVVHTDPRNKRKQTCTEAEAAKVKEQIEAYVAQGPRIDGAAAKEAATQKK